MLIVLDGAVQTPDVAGQTPDVAGQSPDVAGQSPDVAGQAPDAEGLARPQSSFSPVHRELAKAPRIRDLRSRSIVPHRLKALCGNRFDCVRTTLS